MGIFTRSILLYSLLAFGLIAVAQKNTGSISGKILTADGIAAPGVTVEFKTLHRFAITDENGLFKLNHLPAARDSFAISSVASEMFSKPIEITHNPKDIGIIY